MGIRKINESTLTAIGNAIRSKTGGSALINPEDMAGEIDSIQTGGGTRILTKLGEYTVEESASNITITATEQMQNCEMLYIVADLVLSASDWIYPNVDTLSGSMGYFNKTNHLQQSFGLAHLSAEKGATSRYTFIGELTNAISKNASSLSSITFKTYTSGVTINSGTIEVWGYV